MSTSPYHCAADAVLPVTAISIYCDGQYSVPRLHHPEGLAIGPDGAVWCGNAEGDIVRIDPQTRAPELVASTGGFTLGMAFDGEGRLYVCDQRSASVWRLEPASRQLEPFSSPGIRIPNYPVVDAARNCLYVSDSFAADRAGPGVWRYDLDSGEGRLWWDRPMTFANGMALSDDGARLYVVETFARRVSAISIEPGGEPTGVETVAADLPGLPDGIAIDDRGTLFVSCYEPSRIIRIGRGGQVDIYAEDLTAHALCHPTNIAFSGADLFAANLGRWHISHIAADTTGTPVLERLRKTGQ